MRLRLVRWQMGLTEEPADGGMNSAGGGYGKSNKHFLVLFVLITNFGLVFGKF
jgi:hypothetical protein